MSASVPLDVPVTVTEEAVRAYKVTRCKSARTPGDTGNSEISCKSCSESARRSLKICK